MYIKEKLKKITVLRIVKYLVFGFFSLFTRLAKVIYCAAAFNDGRLALYCDLTIGLAELSKKRIQFPHPVGIVMGKGVKIGFDCRVYQNVTIGSKLKDDGKYPVIGNNVTIFANSVIAGDVKIGNNVIVGASTLVIKDIPSNCIVAGNPAKIVRFIK